ncbi:tyrosine-type recombinase/integrase [Salinisphaera orenii]|nr:tyrosine-type recombinase/integrase [Salinisphaera halophila]
MDIIDPDTAAALGERVIRESLEDFERKRARLQPITDDVADALREDCWGCKNGYLEALARGHWEGFHHHVDDFIAEHGLSIQRGTLPYWELCRSVAKAAADGERIAETRLTNDLEGEREILAKYQPSAEPSAERAPSTDAPRRPPTKGRERKRRRFADHLDEFAQDKLELGEWGDSTAEQQTSRNQRFLDLVGNWPLDDIEPRTVRDYRSQLGQLPVHMNKRKAYRDKSAVELVDMEIPESDLMSPRTVGEYLDALSSYLSWCVQMGYAQTNPAREIRKPKWKQNPRIPFEAPELRSLLLNDDMRNGRMGRAWRHWSPLIALLSGTRAGEIAQLRVADVRGRGQGEPVLSINDDDGKKLKTDHARREIPVHSQLIEAGFLEYVDDIERRGYARLFPHLTVPDERPHRNLSRWFAEYRLSCGIGGGEDDNKQFHSFRGTARTAMGRAGVPKPHIDEVIGHAPQEIGERHYQHGYTFDQRKKAIEAIQIDGLDLSPLRGVWRHYV